MFFGSFQIALFQGYVVSCFCFQFYRVFSRIFFTYFFDRGAEYTPGSLGQSKGINFPSPPPDSNADRKCVIKTNFMHKL